MPSLIKPGLAWSLLGLEILLWLNAIGNFLSYVKLAKF